jgi:hypothetical protein
MNLPPSKESTHATKITNNFSNKNNSPTSAFKNFSIDLPTPNILWYSLIKSSNPTIFVAHA